MSDVQVREIYDGGGSDCPTCHRHFRMRLVRCAVNHEPPTPTVAVMVKYVRLADHRAVVAALAQFGGHIEDCQSTRGPDPCDCGWAEATRYLHSLHDHEAQ